MSWSNWAGNQRSRPAEIASPTSADQVSELVVRAATSGTRIRPVGAGHSFTPIAATDGLQVRLDRLSGIVATDHATRRVRIRAGTALHELNPALQALGLALPNLGDIDRQTIAGAIATGTHGTGTRRHGIAAAVTGLTMVLADGAQLSCSADREPEVFAAARIGLGALGIITEVELQCVPAFRLRASERPIRLPELLERIHADADANDHLDAYWFPHTDGAQLKINNRVGDDDPGRPLATWRSRLDDELLANSVFELTNRAGARWPRIVPRLNEISGRALSERSYTDVSWRVFCSSRRVRFTESEYAVPRAAVTHVLTELRDWVDRSSVRIGFPVEIRFTAADDIWLSTAYQRDNAYVAVHQHYRVHQPEYFAAFEAIVADHAGRPHWGKLHTLGRAELAALYPRFADFGAVRDRLDPHRRFASPYLTRLLGD